MENPGPGGIETADEEKSVEAQQVERVEDEEAEDDEDDADGLGVRPGTP